MSFINRIIGPDEELIGICRVHWVYGIKGILWLLGFTALGLFIKYSILSVGFLQAVPAFALIAGYFFWIGLSIGIVLFITFVIVMISTEIALTTKRVIFKTGMIATDVKEVDLEEIKAADVDNGWFGRFLNYGYVLFDARFVQNMQLPEIYDPYRFVKALNEVRNDLKNDSMKMVLGDGRGGGGVVVDEEEAPKAKRRVDDPRYKGLSNDPFEEIEHFGEEMNYDPHDIQTPKTSSKENKRKKIKAAKAKEAFKPVIFEKIRMREKLMDAFTMISTYGQKS